MSPDDFRTISDASETDRSDKRRAWLYVGLMMSCIVLTLPTTPILWEWATKNLGQWFNDIGYLLFLLLFPWIGFYAGRRFPGSNKKALLLLAGFALVYFYLLRYQCKFPAERLHLIEYGLLAFLLYRALRLYVSSVYAYVLGFLTASAFGFIDELIQYVLPNRFFETRDVVTNALAAGLGLLVVKTIINPDSIPNRSTDT